MLNASSDHLGCSEYYPMVRCWVRQRIGLDGNLCARPLSVFVLCPAHDPGGGLAWQGCAAILEHVAFLLVGLSPVEPQASHPATSAPLNSFKSAWNCSQSVRMRWRFWPPKIITLIKSHLPLTTQNPFTEYDPTSCPRCLECNFDAARHWVLS
jgi:hypothetical protein